MPKSLHTFEMEFLHMRCHYRECPTPAGMAQLLALQAELRQAAECTDDPNLRRDYGYALRRMELGLGQLATNPVAGWQSWRQGR
ncbi:MAG: hypothetical protein MUC97_05290 [Bernardetiaceae bacterium]|nr:hypothetical protein [Bernardetiaceae bacterium]